jgi:hypothetical protein
MNGAFAHSIRNHSASLAAIASHTIAAIAFFFLPFSILAASSTTAGARALILCSREAKLSAFAAWISEASH